MTDDAMHFLNEVSERYPTALSLAAGRPPDAFLTVDRVAEWTDTFVRARAASEGSTEAEVHRRLAQYGPTAGLIRAEVARHLLLDYQVEVPPEHVVITNGVQEAILLILLAMCRGPDDVALAPELTYVGFSGAAHVCGRRVRSVGPFSQLSEGLEARLEQLVRAGERPRLLYLIPDHDNPTGDSLSLEARRRIHRACAEHGVWIVEDATYRAFSFDREPPPTVASLPPPPNTEAGVFLLGSFSKAVLPGLRIGFLASSRRIGEDTAADAFASLKAYVSLNTSPLCQAAIGGVLIQESHTLRGFIAPRLQRVRECRDAILTALRTEVSARPSLSEGVSWNDPSGGFFLTLTVPIEFGRAETAQCAKAGVLVCPMEMFAVDGGSRRQVRLSYSSLDPSSAAEAVRRLLDFVERRVREDAAR